MSDIFRLDRSRAVLLAPDGRQFDAAGWAWRDGPVALGGAFENIDLVGAACWLQRDSAHRRRTPVGVIGPREADDVQLACAREVGERLAQCGFAVICGGRQGVMEAACEGVARGGGLSIGLLPEPDSALANPHVGIAIATGIGEARNALIARAALCLVAIGDSYGTLSEVALGLQFGKRVIGLAGAAEVDGVLRVPDAAAAVRKSRASRWAGASAGHCGLRPPAAPGGNGRAARVLRFRVTRRGEYPWPPPLPPATSAHSRRTSTSPAPTGASTAATMSAGAMACS